MQSYLLRADKGRKSYFLLEGKAPWQRLKSANSEILQGTEEITLFCLLSTKNG